MKKAVFLDRDGTINEDIGYLYAIKNIQFIPGAIKALKLLQARFLLFIITNQEGIGKGIFTESEFLKFNEEYKNILKRKNIKIEETFYCMKQQHCMMEPQTNIATFDATGRVTLWTPNQLTHLARRELSHIFGIPAG